MLEYNSEEVVPKASVLISEVSVFQGFVYCMLEYNSKELVLKASVLISKVSLFQRFGMEGFHCIAIDNRTDVTSSIIYDIALES